MAKITAKPITDDTPCTINGKYFGVPLGEVPATYLDWCLGQEWFARKYPEVLAYIKKYEKVINRELKDRKYAVDKTDNYEFDENGYDGSGFYE